MDHWLEEQSDILLKQAYLYQLEINILNNTSIQLMHKLLLHKKPLLQLLLLKSHKLRRKAQPKNEFYISTILNFLSMMQQRDFYGNDYIYKYVKQVSLQEFTDQLFNPSRHQKQMILFSQEEQKEQQELYNHYIYMGGGIFTLSALSVIFYKRIPFLKSIERKWVRVVVKGIMLFGPLQISSIFGQKAQYELLDRQFKMHHRKLQNYIFSGDVKELKQDIEISPV